MKRLETTLPGAVLLELDMFGDSRGGFMELYNQERYAAYDVRLPFVQDNLSHSARGTLRGLHYQLHRPQGKLVSVVRGAVFDVAVDIRRSSPTFKQWFGTILSDENHRQLYIPPGFAHAFCVLSESADFFYKCTDVYDPGDQRAIRWNDPALAIDWPVREPILSPRDRDAPLLSDAELPA